MANDSNEKIKWMCFWILIDLHLIFQKLLIIISACFFHAYTSLVYGVHALKTHALISKRLRYLFNYLCRI